MATLTTLVFIGIVCGVPGRGERTSIREIFGQQSCSFDMCVVNTCVSDPAESELVCRVFRLIRDDGRLIGWGNNKVWQDSAGLVERAWERAGSYRISAEKNTAAASSNLALIEKNYMYHRSTAASPVAQRDANLLVDAAA